MSIVDTIDFELLLLKVDKSNFTKPNSVSK